MLDREPDALLDQRDPVLPAARGPGVAHTPESVHPGELVAELGRQRQGLLAVADRRRVARHHHVEPGARAERHGVRRVVLSVLEQGQGLVGRGRGVGRPRQADVQPGQGAEVGDHPGNVVQPTS